jgi:hypothetical protein
VLPDIPAQGIEIRHAVFVLDDRLAIQNETFAAKLLRGARYASELIGPVKAVTSVDGGPSIIDMDLNAVAVELDLVNPIRAIRRVLAV